MMQVIQPSAKASLALITLNEESCIEAALSSAGNCFHEIVVVDGGSRDTTCTIARRFTDKVVINKFPGDFAAQRNVAIEHCLCPWIFMLDADELISQDLCMVLPELLEANDNVDLFWLPRINTITDLIDKPWLVAEYGWHIDDQNRINYPDWQGRLFRNKPQIRWAGKVHERIQGHKTMAFLNGYHLLHPKTWERQIRQNSQYAKMG
jgi:glycosyltransferase involved in cell wall biosynthesis